MVKNPLCFIEKKYIQFITWIFLLKSMYIIKFRKISRLKI